MVMIDSIQLTALVKHPKDFQALIRLLEALGLRKKSAAEFLPPVSSLKLVERNTGNDADLTLTISDPDSAIAIIRKLGFEISGPTSESFHVVLPGGTRLQICPALIREPAEASLAGQLNAQGKRFALVVSRFNSFITERLLAGAIDGLVRCGVDARGGYDVVRVPGSFEIPSAARALAETRKYSAILCLGCLLRGDTAHYDVIVNEVTRGIGQSAQETGVPHAFGVLTCDTLEQAIDRAGLKMGNKGFEAALAAVEMASLKSAIRRPRQAPDSRKKRATSSSSRNKRPSPRRKS